MPPKLEYRVIVDDSGNPKYTNRILVATAVTGLVRVEWVASRYGQIIPTNWSMVQMTQYMNGYMPLRYQVADAQNLIVEQAIRGDYQWLLLWEHDVCPAPDAIVRLNEFILEGKVPVVSGLYYTRSSPSEPILYRGRGTGCFLDWNFGDLVWVDGVPTGFLLVHMGLLKAMYDESEIYAVNDQKVHRVFDTPRHIAYDPETGQWNTTSGTSDLDWCSRVINGGFLAKAGWSEYSDKQYPFLVDTNLFCTHVEMDGRQFPMADPKWRGYGAPIANSTKQRADASAQS